MGFECLRCGICCTKFQPQISEPEAMELASKLGISWNDLRSNYLDSRWPGTNSFLIRHYQGGCAFLCYLPEDGSSICLIHSFKPACCIDWQPGFAHPECLEGYRKRKGLLNEHPLDANTNEMVM